VNQVVFSDFMVLLVEPLMTSFVLSVRRQTKAGFEVVIIDNFSNSKFFVIDGLEKIINFVRF
jgi:hypothetical protein